MTRLSRAVYKLGRWHLAATGVFAVVQGIAYLPGIAPEPLPGVLQLFADGGIPPLFWAIVWIAVGLFCWAGLPGKRVWWSSGVMAMNYIWGLVYFVAFAQALGTPGPMSRDWFNARTYLALGGYITLLLLLYTAAVRALWKDQPPKGP